MSSIDHRVVEMRFNSSQFESGVRRTTDSLAQLERSLKLDNMADGIEKVSSKFNVFGAIGFAAIQKLTNSAIDFGSKIAGAVLDPLVEGGKRRALNIEQAKFQFQGLGMDIEKAMENALYAVRGTAFGLDEAASAASQLGASGVELGRDMEKSLRGISGLAGMTGSSYDDMANVFVKVAGQGRLMGDDLNRIGVRGINAAATLADALGKTESEIRDMVSKGKIDFQTFADAMDDAFGEQATKANDTYTGSLSNMRAALSRIGEMFWTPSLEKSRRFYNALTPVIDQVADALKPVVAMYERLTKSSAESMEGFLGSIDLSRIKITVTAVVDVLETAMSVAKAYVQPIKNAFSAIFNPPDTDTKWIKNLNQFLWDLRWSVESLRPSAETLGNIQKTFQGLFAALDIGWMVIKHVVRLIGDLISSIFPLETGFLSVTASVGEWIVSLRDAIKNGDDLSKFFDGLGNVLKVPIEIFKSLVGVVKDFGAALLDFDGKGFEGFADKFKSRLEGLSDLGNKIVDLWKGMSPAFTKVYDVAKPIFESITEWFKNLGSSISESFANADFSLLFDAINTGVFASLLIGIRKFFGGFGDLVSSGGGLKDIAESISSIFDGITGSLEAMQNNLKAKTLITIAGALGLLTASIVVLSTIDSKEMVTSLAGLTAMFLQLMGALAIFSKIAATGTFLKMPVVAAGLVILSGALVVLSVAVKNMSGLSWEELAKGLVGVVVGIAALAGATQIMKTRMFGMIGTATGLVILSSAIIILASAVEKFSDLSWSEMGKGLAGVGAVLGGLALFTQLSKASVRAIPQAVGLLVLAGAIKVLYTSVKDFATMGWEEIGRGLAAMGGALAIMALALNFTPPSSLLGSTGIVIASAGLLILADALKKMSAFSWGEIGRSLTLMLGAMAIIAGALLLTIEGIPGALAIMIVAPALVTLADALKKFGDLSWGEIGRALTTLAGALGAIAVAMLLMIPALPGAIALTIVAGALALLAPILKLFGGMEWDEIAKGLVALAGVLGTIGAVSVILAPAVPIIAALSVSIGLLGVAVLAAGGGVLAFAIGLGTLAASGAVGMQFLIDTVTNLIDLIPRAMKRFGEGVIEFANVIERGAPSIANALASVFEAMLNTFDRIAPLIVETMAELVVRIAEAMAKRSDRLAEAATTLIIGFLEGLTRNVPKITKAGYELVLTLAASVLFYAWRFVDKAGVLVVLFINAISSSVRKHSPAIRTAGANLAAAIIDGLTGGLFSRFAQSRVVGAAVSVATNAVNAAKRALGISSPSKVFREIGVFAGEGLALGIGESGRDVGSAAEGVGHTAIMRLQKAVSDIPDLLDRMDWDSEPTITPVLDLSEVSKGANAISNMLHASEIRADSNYGQARGILYAEEARVAAQRSQRPVDQEVTNINFEQNNYSPKELSAADIYRQTRNQISMLRKGSAPNVN